MDMAGSLVKGVKKFPHFPVNNLQMDKLLKPRSLWDASVSIRDRLLHIRLNT